MSLELTQIRYVEDGKPVFEKRSLDNPQIAEEDYKNRLREINETYRIIRDSQTGRAFEIAIVNKSRLVNGAILMPSTMFSSLTQNVGNAVELAAHGAALPDVARVYIAFPGNGGSDNLSRQDRQYVAQTGRFTQKDGQPLDSLLAMTNALNDNDIPIRSISANVEVGRFGLGIMAALRAQSVTSVYLNGLPGISPSADKKFIPTMIEEDHRGQSGRRSEDGKEEFKVSNHRCEEAKTLLPNIYQGVRHGSRLLGTYLRAFPNMQAYTKAFGSYNDLALIENHAVLQDSLAALKRQEHTIITFQFSEFSMLHDPEKCKEFGRKLAEALYATSYHGNMRLFLYPGSLDFHTTAPSRRWAIEKDTLITG